MSVVGPLSLNYNLMPCWQLWCSYRRVLCGDMLAHRPDRIGLLITFTVHFIYHLMILFSFIMRSPLKDMTVSILGSLFKIIAMPAPFLG